MQSWLEEIVQEHEISKTTLKHVKNFLSGVFRHAAQQGYFDGANPVKLAEIPAFVPNGTETEPYLIEEIVAMLMDTKGIRAILETQHKVVDVPTT